MNIIVKILKNKEYKKLKAESLSYFEKAYKFADDELKEKIKKYLMKLENENDSMQNKIRNMYLFEVQIFEI